MRLGDEIAVATQEEEEEEQEVGEDGMKKQELRESWQKRQ